MKDTVVAAVEVSLLVAALAAAAPRGKARNASQNPPVQAQYASFISMAAPAPAPAPAAAAAPAPAPAAPVVSAKAPAPARAATAPLAGAQLWGVVDSIDASSRRLAVKDKHGRLHEVALAADAQVTVGGENTLAGVSDLKAGDNVAVTTKDGAARQVHVRLLFPQPAAPAASNSLAAKP